jgi:hypothetical protein
MPTHFPSASEEHVSQSVDEEEEPSNEPGSDHTTDPADGTLTCGEHSCSSTIEYVMMDKRFLGLVWMFVDQGYR